MGDVRVNPAALRATSAALAQSAPVPALPSAITPASQHPVSVAAATQITAVAATLAQTMNYAHLLSARAAAAYEATAADYERTDANCQHNVSVAFAAVRNLSGTATAQPAPTPPDIPDVVIPPHPPEPVPIPHPVAPTALPQPAETAAAQLHAGDHGAALTAQATTWRTQATTIDGYGQTLNAALEQVRGQWQGDGATSAINRLTPFVQWFSDAAAAHRTAAEHADRVVTAHQRALSAHPTPQYLQDLRTSFANAVARVGTGDLAAVRDAEEYRQKIQDAQTQSMSVTSSYADAATVPAALVTPPPSPVNPAPPAPPKPAIDSKPGQGEPKPQPERTPRGKSPDKPDAGSDGKKIEMMDPGKVHDAESVGLPQDPATPPDVKPAGDTTQPLAASDNPLDEAQMPPVTGLMGPLMQGLGQGTQAAQAAPGGGQGVPQMPQMPTPPMTPPQTPQAPTPPMTPPTDTPFESAGFDPMAGGGPSGAGGGGGGGGVPAAAAPTAPLNAAPVTSGTAPVNAGGPAPAGGIGAGMPMGMMPHGGGKGGSDKQRDAELAPDEPVYIEDRPHTEAFIGRPPTPQPPAQTKE